MLMGVSLFFVWALCLLSIKKHRYFQGEELLRIPSLPVVAQHGNEIEYELVNFTD